MKTFGEFLKQKRLEKNLTQKQLANLLYLSESAVSKWEKNISHPDITMLPKLCEILEVSEHELITASVDTKAREEKMQAKKWRVFSTTWSLFFFICYIVALIPCFICNLAIDKTLSWFWIVLSALVLAFSVTNLPKLITKYKLVLIPLSIFLALCLLLGVCCVYSKGDWFLIVVLSIFLGYACIFTPTYIAKLKIFAKVKKYNDYISVGVIFVLVNILLVASNIYSFTNGYTDNKYWYFTIALPIVVGVFLLVNLAISVKFLPLNKLLKTSVILLLIDLFAFIPPLFVKVKYSSFQEKLNSANIFKADFTRWDTTIIDNNISCIVALSLLALSALFLIGGLIYRFCKKS